MTESERALLLMLAELLWTRTYPVGDMERELTRLIKEIRGQTETPPDDDQQPRLTV